jgi:predicted transposase YdaD
MENKQTAMQELIELLELNKTNEPLPYLIEIIKEVYVVKEKEQIMSAYMICDDSGTLEESEVYAEQYYNRTYGK